MLALTARDLVRERDALLRRAYDNAGRRVDAAITAHRDLIEDGRRYLGAVALLEPVAQGDSISCARTVERVRLLLAEGWSFARQTADGATDCTAGDGGANVTLVERITPGAARPPSFGIAGYGFDSVTMAPVVSLEVPLQDSTGSRAVARQLSITMKLPWLAKMVEELSRDSLSIVGLIGVDQRVIARYPAGARPGSVAPMNSGLQQMIDKRNGHHEGSGVDGVSRLWTYREIPSPVGAPVLLILGVRSAPLHTAANRQVLRSVLTIGVTVVLVLLAASLAAERFFLRDVRALLGATEGIARGDMSARTGLMESAGELGQLAKAFDGMASRLQDRQDRLAHAQKMESVGQLAGGVAHDFNNLLTAIVANTEAAKESLPSDHGVQLELDQVLHAARRSGQLTRQLLAFARQHTFATRVITLDRLLENVSALLLRLIGEHIELRVEFDPELRPTRVDPAQIEQAIINLAVNARDAMPAGGTLSITVRNLTLLAPVPGAEDVDPAGTWVAITVTDTGVGMPPDVLSHVFEPFFTTKPVGEGTGLGLAMVYGTARQHGGHVRVTSEVGVGTSVRILLPVEMSAELSNETPAFGVSLAGTVRGDETLLLVEDEEAVRSVAARLLRSRGYRVLEAPDGEAALALVAGAALDEIDLVVTDLVMPKLGGVDMVEALRGRRTTLPVLLMSGYSATGVSSELLDAPATAFLEKPFNARTLLAAVRTLLDGATAQATTAKH